MPVLFASLFLGGLLQAQPAFRVDAQYVKVPVTVLDETGRAVLGLNREDFQLFDEGTERPIRNFVLDTSPVHVAFLLDASGSVEEEQEEIKYATMRFAEHFQKGDRFSVVAFSDEIQTLQKWTDDLGDLRKSLKKLEKGYRTALYDALTTVANGTLSGVEGKRAIILLTDGLDNESRASYEKAMNTLISKDIVLYIVSRTRLIRDRVEDSDRVEFLDKVMKNVLDDDRSFVEIYFREKETSMNYLAEVNAGRVFYPEKLQALGETYLQIARELKTQYLLTFLPEVETGPEFRQIRVECNRESVRLFHRQIYRAP